VLGHLLLCHLSVIGSICLDCCYVYETWYMVLRFY